MTDRTRLRRALTGPALAACMLLTAACSSAEAPAPAAPVDDTTTSAAATPDDTAADETVDTSPAADAEPLAEPDEALAAAVDALGTSYRFDSEITTAAGDTIAVNGIRVGPTSQYSVEAGGATIEVIVVDNSVWLRQDGTDEWVPSGENPSGDPLASLAAPNDVKRRTPTDATVLVATYTGTAIGLDDLDTVEVDITIDGQSITFGAATNGTTMTTTLSPDATLAPVAAPDPA